MWRSKMQGYTKSQNYDKTTLQHNKVDHIFFSKEDQTTIFQTKTFAFRLLDRIRKDQVNDLSSVKKDVYFCLDKLLENHEVVSILTGLRNLDDYTFEHSVKVGMLSIYVARLLNYDEERLYVLGAGAILHDSGKTQIPLEILKKPSRLTEEEYEEIKRHTEYGFQIINACKTIPKKSAYIAKYHHERSNGKGYPEGLLENQIRQEARIVAIADVYDALVSERIYRKKMEPFEVLNYIMTHEKEHFDNEIFKVFLEFIGCYPVGTKVKLSNDQLGLVIKDNEGTPSRPVVKILQKENHLKESEILEEELDLSIVPNLYIRECC
jgi:putative nucleotidyltransferase with HDIG domain